MSSRFSTSPFFLKSSASTSFPQIRLSAFLIFVLSPRTALYPSRFAMHLVNPRVMQHPDGYIDGFSPRVARRGWMRAGLEEEPHLSLLHVGLCSQQQARAADTGGGGGGGGTLRGGGCCGSNDVTLERLQPVLDRGISGVTGCAKVLPPSLVPPLTLICSSGLLFPNKATGL